MKNTPPPTSRTGALSWMAFCAAGFSVKVAVRALKGLRPGVMTHTISQGRIPLTPKTAIRMPQVRNHRLAFGCIVARTSALMMALSMLVIDSKTARPAIVNTIPEISISASCSTLQVP